jgi:hypothetical protein
MSGTKCVRAAQSNALKQIPWIPAQISTQIVWIPNYSVQTWSYSQDIRKTGTIFERIIAVFIDWGLLGIRKHLPKAYRAFHTVAHSASYSAVVLHKDVILTTQIVSEVENSQLYLYFTDQILLCIKVLNENEIKINTRWLKKNWTLESPKEN